MFTCLDCFATKHLQENLKNPFQTLSTSHAPFDSKPLPETKPVGKGKSPDSKVSITADRQNSPEDGEEQVQSIINGINTCINPALLGTELYDQQEIDRILE